MSRSSAIVAGAVWTLAIVLVVVLAFTGMGPSLPRAYCAAWLLLVSLPLGALPMLMLLDLLDIGETSVSAPLRYLLAGLPILAILVVPVLLGHDRIYLHASEPPHGFAAHWFERGFYTIRTIGYLVLWLVLALFFVRRGRPRRTVAGIGLFVHVVIGTLAAYDWFMALDAGFTSSAYGLLVIAAQGALALTTAALMALVVERRAGPDRAIVLATLVAVAVATFMQFTEYLVIWSANLPKEIVWYQARAQDALGPFTSVAGPLVLASAVLVLLPSRFGMRRAPLTVALAALLVVEVVDVLLLASPGRGFSFGPLAVAVAIAVALAGLVAVCAIAVAGRPSHGVRHG